MHGPRRTRLSRVHARRDTDAATPRDGIGATAEVCNRQQRALIADERGAERRHLEDARRVGLRHDFRQHRRHVRVAVGEAVCQVAHIVGVRECQAEGERVVALPILRLEMVLIVGNPLADAPPPHAL